MRSAGNSEENWWGSFLVPGTIGREPWLLGGPTGGEYASTFVASGRAGELDHSPYALGSIRSLSRTRREDRMALVPVHVRLGIDANRA